MALSTGERELSILCWNVMEFPNSKRESHDSPAVEELTPFCELVLKQLKREDDKELLLSALSSTAIINAHSQLVLNTVREAMETRGCNAALLQGISRDLEEELQRYCAMKRLHACFSSGNEDRERCAGITCIICKMGFDEKEGGGIEIIEGKTTRFFAAARRGDSWLISCHVPSPAQVTETAKQDAGLRTVQKLVQEVHRKGKLLVIAGDWNVDVKAVESKVASHMPYGTSSCTAHTEAATCYGTSFPVDGVLEIN
jgi:hypothetical protein